MYNDEYYMNIALEEAKIASSQKEVPVGCIIVHNNEIIAKAHNQRHQNKSVFGHAEILAIHKANQILNSWILDNCILYVTLEPCLMCAGAILQSRIKKVVYATKEPKFGVLGSIINICEIPGFNHQIEVISGILADKAQEILKDFFKEIRKSKLN